MSLQNQNGLLNGRVALVTAGGQGIGRAVAERLIEQGAQTHVSDLNADLLSGLSAASTQAVDATNENEIKSWINKFDHVDILVHAVGYVHQGTIEECNFDDWRRSQSITLDSTYFAFKHIIPKMRANGGSVISIASVASSIKGFPKRAAYGSSKAGVIGLVKACAADYLKENIRFNAVCPGTVDSPSLRERMAELAETLGSMEAAENFFLDRQPSGRLGTAEEIAGVCAFLSSEEARFMTGQTLNVDGGITI
jgi:2-keto-3-deoxy-L-fuconate dehydrogenase